jgi:hypothetical protein
MSAIPAFCSFQARRARLRMDLIGWGMKKSETPRANPKYFKWACLAS